MKQKVTKKIFVLIILFVAAILWPENATSQTTVTSSVAAAEKNATW